jgi:DNA invertase Pin-like site-specific DNA recombinase
MATKLRCAIYTRKSSEEGLEQDFNSLHAQRESCEAYVLSQAGEGWSALSTLYDDGGFSGGSMDRPGLKRLIDDIGAGKVDVVVVYKVDRLTRSLADFAKIVEAFDARGVSFVSVTQAFNTTSSMGRLTLNVLLSFAQFEREVTGERIRDKIAASKAKGMWMGGMPPLGYDVRDRKLIVNEAEAEIVRRIFERYLVVESARGLVAELHRDGVMSKAWASRAGKAMGGRPLHRGAVFHILASRIYVGDIVHKEKVHQGQHAAIIPRELFEAVAAKLQAGTTERTGRVKRAAKAALVGKLFDDRGQLLSPSFSYGRNREPYRYYIAMELQVGRGRTPASSMIQRVSAPAVESFMVALLRRLSGRDEIDTPDLLEIISRVELRAAETHVVLNTAALLPDDHLELAPESVRRRLEPSEHLVSEPGLAPRLRIVLPQRLQLRGGAKCVLGADRNNAAINPALAQALRRAHADLASLSASPLTDPVTMQDAVAPATQHGRLACRLAFLSPGLQRAFLDGTHPRGLTLTAMTDDTMPLAWDDQPAWLQAVSARLR